MFSRCGGERRVTVHSLGNLYSPHLSTSRQKWKDWNNMWIELNTFHAIWRSERILIQQEQNRVLIELNISIKTRLCVSLINISPIWSGSICMILLITWALIQYCSNQYLLNYLLITVRFTSANKDITGIYFCFQKRRAISKLKTS